MNDFLLRITLKKINVVITWLIIVFAGLHLFIPVYNHYCFRTYAFDYAVYNFAFYDYAHLNISNCPIYHNVHPCTFLQDHFSLTLMFFSPFYWLFSWLTGTFTLIIIQWLIIIYGAWGSFKFILFKTKDYHTALLATLFYFILIGRFTAAAADCNLAIIGSAIIPVFFTILKKTRYFKHRCCICF